jgi:hypothetical protein
MPDKEDHIPLSEFFTRRSEEGPDGVDAEAGSSAKPLIHMAM